ncbi:hypothetical protein R1flu_028917 [Riccia fluitans]|uniref:Uncharacterized protein n=1 Tax=Riccia fluitans TaxID=41844 RepID=A0ABD1XN19_9MARC
MSRSRLSTQDGIAEQCLFGLIHEVPAKSKGSKELQNEMAYWNGSGRAMAPPEARSKDVAHENSYPNWSVGSRTPMADAIKRKGGKELHMAPAALKAPSVTTQRRTAPPKQHVVSEERYIPQEEKTPASKKKPKSSSLKVPKKADIGEADGRARQLSVPDENRERLMQARRKLEQALEKADSLVDQLEKLEDNIEALEEEKVTLLDQLLRLNETGRSPAYCREVKLPSVESNILLSCGLQEMDAACLGLLRKRHYVQGRVSAK